MITTHIITKNNEKTIVQCLESLSLFNGEILIGDRGSTDSTLEICKKYNVRIVDVSSMDFSDIRNKLVILASNEWQFYLQPWEVITSPFNLPLDPVALNIQVINNDILAKEVRFWHRSLGLKFENPVFESLIDENYNIIEKTIIFTNKHEDDMTEQLTILNNWETANPTLATPHYYKAFIYLSQKRYSDFINEGNKFLFHQDNKIPNVMISYYIALVRLYMFHDTNIINVLNHCLAANFLMAEFWCLLGDVHYKTHRYKEASSLYENAILLGSQRLKSDPWPMDMVKYKKYPRKMINECKRQIDGMKLITTKNQVH